MELTWGQVLAWRMRRQLLAPRGDEPVEEVVRRLGAVPAMSPDLAELAVRTRRSTSEPGEVGRAHADGRVVRTFAFRGATHLMHPAEAGVFLALRAVGRQWELRSWREHYRLEPEDWPPLREVVRAALTEGPLTPAELGEAVAGDRRFAHLGPAFTHPSGTFLKPFGWQGDLVIAPPRDGAFTLQGLDGVVGWAGVPDVEEAGPRAVDHYLRHYGPASEDHLQYWLGEGLSAGRRRVARWWADAADRTAEVEVEGDRLRVLAADLDDLGRSEPAEVVRFVPGHDAWVMGPGTKDRHVVPPDRRDVVTRKAHLVLSGGVVAGTWVARGGDLVVSWLDGSAVPRDALAGETERLAELLGRQLALRVET